MNTFDLKVLAAEKPFFEGKSLSVTIPTGDGEIGILAYHSNCIYAIVPGMLKIKTENDKEIVAAISQGMVKVENNDVLILVDTCELPEEIDINRVKRSQEEAKEALLQKKSITDYYQAQLKMTRAISRLRVKNYNNINHK